MSDGNTSSLQGKNIAGNAFAGFLSGIMTLIGGISYAALIFSGILSGYLEIGIGSALISATVIGAFMAWKSSSPIIIAGPDANISAILALLTSSILSNIAADAPRETVFSTVWAVIAVSTLACGFFLYMVGRFRLGRWIRFIPYPVVGGFLAGTGWLLIRGAFKVMGGVPLTFSDIPALFEKDVLYHWLPGLLFALVLLAAVSRWKSFLVMPSLVIAAIAGTHGLLFASGTPVAEAAREGWLLSSLPSNLFFHTLQSLDPGQIDIALGFRDTGNIVALLLIAAIVILLNSASIEISTGKEMNLDRELKMTGISNVAAAPFGGMVGCIALSRTLMNWSAGADSRLSGIVAALTCGMILFAGAPLLSFLPRPVLGGLLVYIGLVLLIEWIYRGWFRFSRFDYFLVVAIVVIIAFRGFLPGVALGLVAACMLFAFHYSRIPIIKHELSGVSFRSNVERSQRQQALLKERGNSIHILHLQGFIFFGSAYPLLLDLKDRMERKDPAPLKYLLIDFGKVSGLDSSSLHIFFRIRQVAEENGVQLIFSRLTSQNETLLRTAGGIAPGGTEKAGPVTPVFPDLDYAMDWCEEELLREAGLETEAPGATLEDHFAGLFEKKGLWAHFRIYLDKMDMERGFVIFRQGEEADDMVFVESGEVTAFLELENGERKRLRTMGAGTVVGEMGLYLGTPRSATVVTENPGVLYRLTLKNFRKMEKENSPLATMVHQFIVRLLANRLAHANEEIFHLLKE